MALNVAEYWDFAPLCKMFRGIDLKGTTDLSFKKKR